MGKSRSENIETDTHGLIQLIRTLRGDKGCPWDQKQSLPSIMVYLIEEVFELAEAVAADDPEAIMEELGDVLFQVLFIAVLGQEKNYFDYHRLIAANTAKMIRRHPHVFGESDARSVEDIRRQWVHIKETEKQNHHPVSVMDSVPQGLPALLRALRISKRAVEQGFDWDDLKGVMAKVDEEWDEFRRELDRDQAPENKDRLALEFGDLLFTLVNVARFVKIHPETALRAATLKFEKRFRKMEHTLDARNQRLDALSRDEVDRLWEETKASLDYRGE